MMSCKIGNRLKIWVSKRKLGAAETYFLYVSPSVYRQSFV